MRSIAIRMAIAAATLVPFADAMAQGGPGGGMPPTVVEVATPTTDTVAETVPTVGTLRAAESIVVRPELAGRIEKVHFEEGQRVTAGAPLFTLDPSLMQAEVNEWQANVAQSRRETNRAGELVERKLAAQADLDTKRSALAVNEARLSSAKTRLGKTIIRAAFAGVAGLRLVSPGEYVQIGDALVSLVQVDPIKLDFRVPEVHLGRLAVGQRVDLALDAFPGEVFQGEVYAIDPQLDTNSRAAILRASVANPEARLKPGLFARVSLRLATRENAMLVPEQALWPEGSKQNVYVIEDGKAKLVEVTTGLRRTGMVEILTGLKPTAVVITAGQNKIGPGMPVQALAAKPGAAATPVAAH